MSLPIITADQLAQEREIRQPITAVFYKRVWYSLLQKLRALQSLRIRLELMGVIRTLQIRVQQLLQLIRLLQIRLLLLVLLRITVRQLTQHRLVQHRIQQVRLTAVRLIQHLVPHLDRSLRRAPHHTVTHLIALLQEAQLLQEARLLLTAHHRAQLDQSPGQSHGRRVQARFFFRQI